MLRPVARTTQLCAQTRPSKLPRTEWQHIVFWCLNLENLKPKLTLCNSDFQVYKSSWALIGLTESLSKLEGPRNSDRPRLEMVNYQFLNLGDFEGNWAFIDANQSPVWQETGVTCNWANRSRDISIEILEFPHSRNEEEIELKYRSYDFVNLTVNEHLIRYNWKHFGNKEERSSYFSNAKRNSLRSLLWIKSVLSSQTTLKLNFKSFLLISKLFQDLSLSPGYTATRPQGINCRVVSLVHLRPKPTERHF